MKKYLLLLFFLVNKTSFSQNICGTYSTFTIMTGEVLELKSDSTFLFFTYDCYGRVYSTGKWKQTKKIIMLNSFSTEKMIQVLADEKRNGRTKVIFNRVCKVKNKKVKLYNESKTNSTKLYHDDSRTAKKWARQRVKVKF